MSTQPPGPGQPWPTSPAPWETGRPPLPGQPQQQYPMRPPMPMPVAPGHVPNPVTRPSIWRIAIGVWLGLILFMITLIILGVAAGSAFESQLRGDFRTHIDDNGFGSGD